MTTEEIMGVLVRYGVTNIEHNTQSIDIGDTTHYWKAHSTCKISMELSQVALEGLAAALKNQEDHQSDEDLRRKYPSLEDKYNEYLILKALYDNSKS